jgi:hypothetical protein
MSAPDQQAAAAAPDPRSVDQPYGQEPATWVMGFAMFAGVTMIILGVFQVIEGLSAIFRDEIYVVGARYVFSFDLTAWGWIHLLLGVLLLAAGVALRTAQTWARSVGIAFAALSMIANFMFLPYYPVWSLLIIALDIVVIWALCLYNREPGRA